MYVAGFQPQIVDEGLKEKKRMKGSMQSLKWIVNVLCRYQASSFCSLSLVYQSEVTITV